MKITTRIRGDIQKLSGYALSMRQQKAEPTDEQETCFNQGVESATAALCADFIRTEIDYSGWIEPEHILEACPSIKSAKEEEFQKTFETEILKFIETLRT